MKKMKITSTVTIALLAVITLNMIGASPVRQTTIHTDKWASDFRPYGNYVDEIWWMIYGSGETAQAMLALEAGDIDAHTERVQTAYMNVLLQNPDINLQIHLANRYRTLNLNTDKFPLNITNYRRAMAFGLDKYRINDEAIGGAGQPLDSYVSLVATEWEVESSLTTHFYDKDIVSGNRSLADVGFVDLDGDGWREYDADGSGTFNAGDLDDDDPMMTIEMWPSVGFQPAIVAATVAKEGLEEMGLHSTVVEKEFSWIIDQMVLGNHYVSIWTEGLPIVNPTKTLYDSFRSGTPDNDNYYKFGNATIDAILDEMVAATTAADVKDASIRATKLLAYEQPQIVCYNDVLIDAWRTDKFTFPTVFAAGGRVSSDNRYNPRKARLLNGSYGGILKLSNGDPMDTTNPWMQESQYEANIQQLIFETLWEIDPNTWDPIPSLAYDWNIETVGTGSKYTMYLHPNATWHDGEPVTSADVKFSFEEVMPQSINDIAEADYVTSIETPDDHTVVFNVNRKGYFLFVDITGFGYIVPKHIWEPQANGNYSNFELTADNWIGSGPYKFGSRVAGETIKLLRYPDHRWDIRAVLHPPSTTPSTTAPSTMISSTTNPSTTTSTTTTISLTPGFTLVPILSMILIILVMRRGRKSSKM
ncbi:MAG: ABC transporter substrate-binding protein [Candidatus Kariarchaeaceae archaeon]|jgi:ABC-type transport system substrate-binding protein